MQSAEQLLDGLSWLAHASFRLEGSKTVYIDPWELKGDQKKADLILITHSHYDHLSPSDVKKLAGQGTIVVGTADTGEKLKETLPDLKFLTVAPGARVTAHGIPIEAPPAYNAAKKFHPRDSGWVGFRIEIDGRSYYHTGDTDNTPEIRAVRADVLLIPVGGTYTMNPEEAAEAAEAIAPQVAIPMHWGKIVGSIEDAHLFKARAGVPVRILEIER
jgi:L-ascorbate metabolism protein UlaG (beta-lactamase superfamily)